MLLIYGVIVGLGFIGTIVFYAYTKQFSYLVGWLLPVPFVVLGLYWEQKMPDLLLQKAKEYGEYGKKPKGFMLLSSVGYILTYVLFVIPFIVEGVVSSMHGVSLTNGAGWFNIYCSLTTTFVLPLLLFVVKFLKNYFINRNNSKSTH